MIVGTRQNSEDKVPYVSIVCETTALVNFMGNYVGYKSKLCVFIPIAIILCPLHLDFDLFVNFDNLLINVT